MASKRRMIAAYGKDRILLADLCQDNQDEWIVGCLLNVADILTYLMDALGASSGKLQRVKACKRDYCIEVEANEGGFLAWEVSLE